MKITRIDQIFGIGGNNSFGKSKKGKSVKELINQPVANLRKPVCVEGQLMETTESGEQKKLFE